MIVAFPFPGLLSSAAIPNSANFQHLNVRESIAADKTRRPPSSHHHKKDDGGWRVKLLHRDTLPTAANSSTRTTSTTLRHRLNERLKRDAVRAASLSRQLTRAGSTARYRAEDFGSDIVSGMEQGSWEYLVQVGVGSPPRNQFMVVDSGSDIVWLQCQPCLQCYHQSDPVFDPADSVSFAGVPCDSSVCGRLETAADCQDGRCRYAVSYGDGSYTKGTLALETLTFGATVVRNVAIGCGHRNRGLFFGAAGLLGLGGGSMSFVGQLGGQVGGAFGYCLVSRGADSFGSLIFGRSSMPVGAAWVTLLRNPRVPSYYYVGLVGLGVGGVRVAVSEDLFRLSEAGDGGVVMDTGTAVTRLPREAYEALRDAFAAGTAGLPAASGLSIFDTCYDLSGYESVRVPTVSFYFSSGAILTIPARNYLIPVDETGKFCFAFAPSTYGLSIIGNIQQEGIEISVDAASGFIGFGPNTC
ncbi:Protein ASPARTIC PROTEASE IN GUARD CELL 2 [Asimina triloba]